MAPVSSNVSVAGNASGKSETIGGKLKISQ
jgi:hypothetical protein